LHREYKYTTAFPKAAYKRLFQRNTHLFHTVFHAARLSPGWNGKRYLKRKKQGRSNRKVYRVPVSSLYGFPLALVIPALNDHNTKALFTIAPTLPAQFVILPPAIRPDEQRPFQFHFLAHSWHHPTP